MDNMEIRGNKRRPSNNGQAQKRPCKSSKTDGRKKRKKGGCLVPLIIILIILAIFVFIGRGYIKNDMSTGAPTQEIAVEIPNGTSVNAIADLLEEKQVIDSAVHFKTMCKLHSEGTEFKSGYYVFNNNMTFDEITSLLNSGDTNASVPKLLVKEGMWLKEIAAEVEKLGICSADEFIEAANSRDYDFDFVKDIPQRDNLLEGYLYPNTYFIREDMTAYDVVNMLLEEFNKQITENDIVKRAKSQGITLDDAVKIASLIEGEVRLEAERVMVSSVIHNRLSTNTKLQIDASILYALGERGKSLTTNDLKLESPYNTYYVEGLPEGPISNPRIESVIAACEPADTDYLFYVVKDVNTGEHAFSKDYDEFLKNKSNYKAQVN